MKRAMQVCYWLLSPESSEELHYPVYQSTPWWLPNCIKVGFWYCLALLFVLFISRLQ